MKKVMTICGIRPDWIRMSAIFTALDNSQKLQHIQISTGQHFDDLLSGVFFRDLNIRQPDYNLGCGAPGKEFHQQIADLNEKLLPLLHKIQPDMVMFLGDSNSVVSSFYIRREFGDKIKIVHIEGGMRSGDWKNQPEESNRIVCDNCSDIIFVYHEDYKQNLLRENIKGDIHVVGNTIVEVCRKYSEDLFKRESKKNQIILDIHRPENFTYPDRMSNILNYADLASRYHNLPVFFVGFKRTLDKISEYNIKIPDRVHVVPLMSYLQFLEAQYDALFVVSDSGTSQEETSLLRTPVVVPRDFTERPQSMKNDCSFMLDANSYMNQSWFESFAWLARGPKMYTEWLGDGSTAERIVKVLENV